MATTNDELWHTGEEMARPSKELFDWWRPKLKALDPWREVQDDEIQQLYAEREGAVYSDLAAELGLAAERPADVKVILCGARGSGKTTELARLAHDVKQDFCVVQTDLATGLQDGANTLAVVTLLGVAALHATKVWSAPDTALVKLLEEPDNAVKRGATVLDKALGRFRDAVPSVTKLLESISSIVTLFDPTTGAGLATAAHGVATAGSAVSTASRLRLDLTRGPLEGRLPPDQHEDAQAVVEAVNGILHELELLAGRPPLLLADGLDKRLKLDEVALALDDERLLRDLQAPLVLTGPVNLRHDPRFRAVPGNLRLALLYNVPIMRRAKSPKGAGSNDAQVSPEGVEVLHDLYRRRQAGADLPEELFGDDLIELAANNCAGIMRDFLWLLHEAGKTALIRSARRVEQQDLHAAMKKRRLELEGYLDEDALTILKRVLDKGTLPGSPEADTLLFENFIACYHNGDIWFRPHELIVEFVRHKRSDG